MRDASTEGDLSSWRGCEGKPDTSHKGASIRLARGRDVMKGEGDGGDGGIWDEKKRRGGRK